MTLVKTDYEQPRIKGFEDAQHSRYHFNAYSTFRGSPSTVRTVNRSFTAQQCSGVFDYSTPMPSTAYCILGLTELPDLSFSTNCRLSTRCTGREDAMWLTAPGRNSVSPSCR